MLTGQAHSVDYRAEKTGEANGFDCGYESGWADTVDDGLGAHVNPNSFVDFESVVAACGGAIRINLLIHSMNGNFNFQCAITPKTCFPRTH